MVTKSQNQSSPQEENLILFEACLKKAHNIWNQINQEMQGKLFGDTEGDLNPKRAELSKEFETLLPLADRIIQFGRQSILEGIKMSLEHNSLFQELNKLKSVEEQTAKLNKTLLKAVGGLQEEEAQNPHISIELGSLFDLASKGMGWKVETYDSNKLEELIKLRIMTVGVLGAYDAGKTYLCNLLGDNRLRSGHQHRTSGIEAVYPVEAGIHYGLIDVPGSQEAHPINDPAFIAKIPLPEEEHMADEPDPNQKLNSYLKRYNVMHIDAKLIHSLKERFIVENVDMVILVTNKLADTDQEMINKNKNYYRKWIEKSKKHFNSKKFLCVVHNFKNLSKIEDVKHQIEKDIVKCFQVEDTPMFNTGEIPSCNNRMYIDELGVCHLVIACENSEAGNYYNPSTLNFLKSKIRTTETKSTLNLVEAFKDFCNTHLTQMIKQEVELVYDKEKGALVNTKKTDIKLDNIAWTSLGEVVTSEFELKYSVISRELDAGEKEITVDVESLDCEIVKEPPKKRTSHMILSFRQTDGYHCLRLKGEKVMNKMPNSLSGDHVQTPNPDEDGRDFMNYNRGEGKFNVPINLVKNMNLKERKMENLNNGIIRFTFVFNNDDPSF